MPGGFDVGFDAGFGTGPIGTDTQNKRRSVLQCIPGLNTAPVPDNVIGIGDREQCSWLYSGLPPVISKLLNGTLITSGILTNKITLKRSYGGTLTTAGALIKKTSISKGGTLTFSGDLSTVLIIVQALAGTLSLAGGVVLNNPDWLLIPDDLNWQGAWSITTSYDDRDVVLYQDGDQIHAFVSKQSHNIGYNPVTSYQWWTRLVQTEWNK